MSYYAPALVERIKTIKRLQQEQYLPLSLIKEVLEDAGDTPDDLTTRAAISRVLARAKPDESRSRAELVLSGVKATDLDWLRSLELVSPKGQGERYSGDDLSLLRLLGAARKAGLAPEMLPASILADYARAIRELVRTELALFRAGVAPRAGGRLGALTEVAATLSEELVVLLRRKLLLPTLKELESGRKRARRAHPLPAPGQKRPGPGRRR
jgi:DNA-binding transcriptional MerR regulator